jgi:integrase
MAGTAPSLTLPFHVHKCSSCPGEYRHYEPEGRTCTDAEPYSCRTCLSGGGLRSESELTNAKRLSIQFPREKKESSSSRPGTQGWSRSDGQNNSHGAARTRTSGGESSLGEEEKRERAAPLGGGAMARRRKRSSYQKGYVFPRKTANGLQHVIRFRVRKADGSFKHLAETVRSPRKKDAERVLAERLREVNRGDTLPADVTFEEFADTHWETYLQQNTKPSTRAVYKSNLKKHLLPVFGEMLLAEITAVSVMTFLAEKQQAGLSPKTLLNLYVLLQKMLNLAVDLELTRVNPMKRVPKPKVQRKEKPALTPTQLRAVIEAVPEEYRGLFVVLALTGVRIGEALGLKWRDVDTLASKLYFRRSVWHRDEQAPKTDGTVRAKHLVPALADALARHRTLSRHTGPESYVFATASGRPLDPNDVRKRVLYPAIRLAGIERTQARAFGFHLFRHSAGSLVTEATGNLKKTQSFLGHSSVAVTGDVYAHLQLDSEIETMSKLEEAIFPIRAQVCSKGSVVVN